MVRAQYTRPNCTHITMDIIHFSAVCDVCGNESTMGWVYECQQDRLQNHIQQQPQPTLEECSYNKMEDTEIPRIISMGFSPSIIQQAEEGLYSNTQIELLIKQKACVKKLASSVETELLHPNVTVRRKIFPGFRKADIKHQINLPAKCGLRCCHACRPYYKDRVYASLNGIADDSNSEYNQTPPRSLKVVDAEIVRQLGLRKPADGGGVRLLFISHAGTEFEQSASVTPNSSYGDLGTIEEVDLSDDVARRLADMPVSPHMLENAQIREQNRLTYPSLLLDRSEIELQNMARNTADVDTNVSSKAGNLMKRFRRLSQEASRKMLKRSLSSPIASKGRFRKHSGDTDGDVSSLASSNLSSVALSEIAVEEHVPDLITQA